MAPTELPVAEKPEPAGFVAAALGCAVGAGLGLLLGVWIGSAYSNRFMPNAELEGLGPLIVGEALGVWFGGAIGVLAALKAAGRRAAAPTAALAMAAIPTWAVVSLPSFGWLLQRLSDGGVATVVQIALPVVILAIPPPLASRWLVLHNEKVRASRNREENAA